jgi:hypothetical protein
MVEGVMALGLTSAITLLGLANEVIVYRSVNTAVGHEKTG